MAVQTSVSAFGRLAAAKTFRLWRPDRPSPMALLLGDPILVVFQGLMVTR
jgi:hypothetical protein